MSIADHEIGAVYWRDAIYDPTGTLLKGIERRNITEGDPREPLKFKAYRGLQRRVLVPPALSVRVPGAADVGALTDDVLSTLLYYSYGVIRQDLHAWAWPYHRVVPSARCFFPTELYIAIADGVYYYDPMHHALVRVRKGEHGAPVSAALQADVFGAVGFVLLTSLFWKSAFRYRDYAYRLCTEEAGIVAGSVLLTASALGMEGHVHFQFSDEALNRFLALDPTEENVQLVVPLYPRGNSGRGPDRKLLPLGPQHVSVGDAWPELRTVHAQPSTYDSEDLAVLTGVIRASRSKGIEGFERAELLGCGLPLRDSSVVSLPAGVDDTISDLGATLRSRDSGPNFMDFLPGKLPLEAVCRIACEVARPYTTDVVAEDGRPACECYLVVQAVEGIAEGIYRVRRDGAALEQVAHGPVAGLLGSISTSFSSGAALSTVNFARAPLVVFLAVPRKAGIERFGARSFRILNQVAGIGAHRVCLASAEAGLSARVHNGYSARLAEQALRLSPDSTVLFQIAVGRSSSGPALRLPVVF